ncbi:serine protease, partial [Rhizobiaceae sp. 2RAB30]
MKPSTLLPALRKTMLAATAALFVGATVVPSFVGVAEAKGPESVADLAAGLLDAVVNISTSQTVKGSEGEGAVPAPQLPPGSPFQEFFDDFFNKDRGGKDQGPSSQKVQSLGSGF